MRKIAQTLLSAALVAGSLIATACQAQVEVGPQTLSKQDLLPPGKLNAYLRQPDGLEKLSAEVGDVTLNDFYEQWGVPDLRSLTTASDFIVVATVQSGKSRLIEDGDSIATDYRLRPLEILKGVGGEQFDVTYVGGEVTFSNGHKATLHSPFWDSLKASEKYIFFLKRDGDTLTPVIYHQSVLALRGSDDSVHTLDKLAPGFTITRELDGASVASIKSQIRSSAELPPSE